MIRNVLGKNNERNRRKQCKELDNGGNIDFACTFVERAEEGELGQLPKVTVSKLFAKGE